VIPALKPRYTAQKLGIAMTPRHSTIRKLLRTSLAGSIAILMVAGSAMSASAGDDDEDDELPDVKIFRGILGGIGLKKDGAGSGIDYRERSPLVVPPTRDLPPPEASNAPANAAFPIDQDEKRRKQAKKQRNQNWDWSDLGRQLSPGEMKKGAAAIDKRGTGRTVEENQAQMKPSELGYKGGMFDFTGFFRGNNQVEVGKFESEPPRASLVEPPSGYRTPSAAQPYGLGKDTSKSKPQDIYDRPATGTGMPSR
jgi:hypothetical protein